MGYIIGSLTSPEHLLYRLEDALVGFGLGVAEVLLQHFADVADGTHICRQLVLHLHHVFCLAAYLSLALPAQLFADGLHGRHHNAVEQMVALNVEVCGIGCNAKREKRVFCTQILFLHIRETTLQLVDLHAHLVVQLIEHLIQLLRALVLDAGNGIEVRNGEGAVFATAIHHDIPHKQGEYDAAVAGQEVNEIESGSIIERCHNADVMQGRGITLIILYGIDEGVYDIRIVEHEGGIVIGSLQQVVVVGIDTGYHITPHTIAHKRQKGRLLALREIGTDGEHHLKITCLVFKLTQYHAPEEHVVIALHIRHNTATAALTTQGISSREIIGIDMAFY